MENQLAQVFTYTATARGIVFFLKSQARQFGSINVTQRVRSRGGSLIFVSLVYNIPLIALGLLWDRLSPWSTFRVFPFKSNVSQFSKTHHKLIELWLTMSSSLPGELATVSQKWNVDNRTTISTTHSNQLKFEKDKVFKTTVHRRKTWKVQNRNKQTKFAKTRSSMRAVVGTRAEATFNILFLLWLFLTALILDHIPK